MNELTTGEHDVLSFVRPDTLIGALACLVIFVATALLLSRLLRGAVHASMSRGGHIDRTSAHRDKLRSTLLAQVAERFTEAHIPGSGTETATFA